jgi:hypothetical protein
MRSAAWALAACLGALSAVGCHRLIPRSGPPYSITGIVTSLDPATIVVRHKTGQEVSIALSPGTVVSRRAHPATLRDVAVGMRIVVVYHFAGGAAVADEVRLFRPPVRAAITQGATSPG